MSDGPHKNLPVTGKWKKGAEIADTPAYELEFIVDAFQRALADDWGKEVPPALLGEVLEIACSPDGNLFQSRAERLEHLRLENAGFVLLTTFLEQLILETDDQVLPIETVTEAACATLSEWISRRERQIEEHYLTERPGERTQELFNRVGNAIPNLDIRSFARRIARCEAPKFDRRRKSLEGIDDGVPLP